MAILLPKENDSELTPSGSHVVICYRTIDLGTQEVDFQGKLKHQRKIMLSWEIPSEKMKDGRCFTVHKKFTLSASAKGTLRKFLESWRGQPFTEKDFGNFDITKLIGKPALMSILHAPGTDGTVYANIASIMAAPKGTTIPAPENEPLAFSLSAFDPAVFDKLSDSLKEQIKKSPEYQALDFSSANISISEDALPF